MEQNNHHHQNVHQPSNSSSPSALSSHLHQHHHHHHQQRQLHHRTHNNSSSSIAASHDPRNRQFHPLQRHQVPHPPVETQQRPSTSSSIVPAHNSQNWQTLHIPTISPFVTPSSSRPSTPRRNTAARLINPRNYSPRSPSKTVKRVDPPSAAPSNTKRNLSTRTKSEKRHSKYSLRSWPSLKSPSSSLQAELGSVEDRKISETIAIPLKSLTKQKPRAYSLGGPDRAARKRKEAEDKTRPAMAIEQDAPIPAGIADLEAGQRGNRFRSNSKASLPLGQNAANDDQQRQSSASESPIEWGPLHPCYPHLNPHVPLTSPLYSTTRVIRVPRDWMVTGDLSPAFTQVYPEVLDGYLSQQQFRELTQYINDQLTAIFNPYSLRNFADNCIGLVTLWLWDDFGLTAVKRRLAALEKWIEKWNREIGSQDGVQIIPLRRTAYISLDIQMPDPEISPEPVSRSLLQPDDGASQPRSPYGMGNMPARVAAAA